MCYVQESFEGNKFRSGEYYTHQVGDTQFKSLREILINIEETCQEEEY